MCGAAQPARESQAHEIYFRISPSGDGSTIHIFYDAQNPPIEAPVKSLEEILRSNIPAAFEANPSGNRRITKAQINISNSKAISTSTIDPNTFKNSFCFFPHMEIVETNRAIRYSSVSTIDLGVFLNILHFFPHIEELEINLPTFEENDAKNLRGSIKDLSPNLKKIIIKNRISAQAWDKLIEGLKKAPSLESLEIDFDSIKELEVPPLPKPPQGFWASLFSRREINKSGAQRCAQLLASLPFLEKLSVNIKGDYTSAEYRELFEFFAQETNLQQIHINDSNPRSRTYEVAHYKPNEIRAGKEVFNIQRNNAKPLSITISYTETIHYTQPDNI